MLEELTSKCGRDRARWEAAVFYGLIGKPCEAARQAATLSNPKIVSSAPVIAASFNFQCLVDSSDGIRFPDSENHRSILKRLASLTSGTAQASIFQYWRKTFYIKDQMVLFNEDSEAANSILRRNELKSWYGLTQDLSDTPIVSGYGAFFRAARGSAKYPMLYRSLLIVRKRLDAYS